MDAETLCLPRMQGIHQCELKAAQQLDVDLVQLDLRHTLAQTLVLAVPED